MVAVRLNKTILLAVFTVFIGLIGSLNAAVITVSKDGRGAYSTIQAAVDKAGPGDTVKILDAATYAEQVTIDSGKAGITLKSTTPLSTAKPKIVWQDRVNVGPRTVAEAADTSNMATFDRNGALRILGTRGVTIDGITIDGGGAYPFGYPSVWLDKVTNLTWPMQHGNAAITIWVSGDVTVRNCDIGNAYIGINFKDRNEGGVFANANPADNKPWVVVPLSGFGKTGNHLIEYNRVHNNSYGMFFESTWDLGSTLRYNLIYENHHITDAMATQVKTLTSDGSNHPGGAIWFKDQMLSPVAIYNNTFWHNYLIFVGSWRPGSQLLIFNNIYAQPFMYWGSYTVFSANPLGIDKVFPFRMKNCVYAAQQQAPSQYSVQVENGFQLEATSGPIPAGTSITTPFPKDANIKWFETTFKSTDPLDPGFLVPNWGDTQVVRLIRNQGWSASGVKNPDGSIADLGAISFSGNRPNDVALIKPTAPVLISGTGAQTVATMTFNLYAQIGTLKNPTIKYFRFIKNILVQPNGWGDNVKPVPSTDIIDLPVPAAPVVVGGNTYTVSIPARLAGEDYAFVEVVVEGTGADGKTVSTSVGFLPFRRLDYKFIVEVWSLDGKTKLSEVHAGDAVKLRITAQKADGSAFFNQVDPVDVRLNSGFVLLVPTNPPVALTIPGGILGTIDKTVMFTKVPQGGIEYVMASGQWVSGTQVLPFLGTSNGIRILPGTAAKVLFQDPPSNSIGANPPIIDPGTQYRATVQVFDAWDNKVAQPTQISLSSLTPAKGNILGGSKIITTDSSGRGPFLVQAGVSASENDLFTLQAVLVGTISDTDLATMKVGKPRDKLWIFYADTLSYDPAGTIIDAQVGDKVRITVIAASSARMDSIVTSWNTTISIEDMGGKGLSFYASEAATQPVTTIALTNGRADLWVTAIDRVDNGQVRASPPDTLRTLQPSDARSNIYFQRSTVRPDSAFFYADNGQGRVNRVELFYNKDLTRAIIDSIATYWPSKTQGNRKSVTGSDAVQLAIAADNRHLTLSYTTPYPLEITAGETNGQLGTNYIRPNSNPDVTADSSNFMIKDRVGPLMMSAGLVERTTAGKDTFYLTFSEPLLAPSLKGATIVLIHGGVSTVLSVDSAIATLTGYRFVVPSQSVTPVAGDSLRINAQGSLADAFSNRAHTNNRPVVITLIEKAAETVSAYYQDRSGDGTVDTAVIIFNKRVKTTDLLISFDWGLNVRADNLAGAKLFYLSADSTKVGISLVGAFNNSVALRTSGAMFASVSFYSYPGQTRTTSVTDSAAPVALTAIYYPGIMIDENTPVQDTIVVTFSEEINGTVVGTNPFLMRTVSNAAYTMDLATMTFAPQGTSWRFPVTAVTGVESPVSGDSLSINPAAHLKDASYIEQTNPANRRVVLKVMDVKVPFKTSISSNPFVPSVTTITAPGIPGGTKGTLIEVSPLARALSNVSINASITIFDAVGNMVVSNDAFKANLLSSSKLYYAWNGLNRNNRIVGTGTYLAVITIRYTYDDNTEHVEKQQMRLGVKR